MKKSLMTLLILGSLGLIACGGGSSGETQESSYTSSSTSSSVEQSGPITLSVRVDMSRVSDDNATLFVNLEGSGIDVMPIHKNSGFQTFAFPELSLGDNIHVWDSFSADIKCDEIDSNVTVDWEGDKILANITCWDK